MKEYVKPVSIVYGVHSISCFCNSEGNLHPSEPDPEGEGQLSKEAFWDDWGDDEGW